MDTKALTADRGSEYGHPLDHFSASESVHELLMEHFEAEEEASVAIMHALTEDQRRAFRHASKFIIDKLVRACRSPLKPDHWDDIAGYARCAKMAFGIEESQG